MDDPMLDQMTRLRLRLMERKLQNERDRIHGSAESALSTRSCDDQEHALHRALKRKRNLLQRMREEHMSEDLRRPHTWGGTRGWSRQNVLPPLPPHTHVCLPPPAAVTQPPPAAQLPRVLQQIPQQPTTIIQQLPQQQPIIAQVPPPLPCPSSKSGSIKEDMMELMLMQNAQMHQIIMHNMMLKAVPLGALSPPGGAGQAASARQLLTPPVQTKKPRGDSVHHHHHYSTPAVPLPPIGCPLASPVMSPAVQGGTFHPTLHHVTGPIMLSPLNTAGVHSSRHTFPLGL
ncbi:uncharacterized protein C21orf58 isoform X2 [Brienomyrus brachyistius]|uniref:uncharacterized protein C21orf58 isoform X2 n=1 Tax=Brienomyrus brachyistius TaxID=42636 RepID=UPI0020B18E65|nr:uncharacterized protein C21orf58 isoform X2 [Brienomyrus brachyistius]